MCPDTPQTPVRNSLINTIRGPRCWPGLQSPQIPVWSSICKTCWSRSDPWRPTPQHTGPRGSTIKHPGARHHRTTSEVLSPCLDRSELLCLHKGNLHNIRHVVIIVCLIGVSIQRVWSSYALLKMTNINVCRDLNPFQKGETVTYDNSELRTDDWCLTVAQYLFTSFLWLIFYMFVLPALVTSSKLKLLLARRAGHYTIKTHHEIMAKY